MLLNYSVSNWACFKDEAEFSMQAGPERDEGHLSCIGAVSRPLKVLPLASIYGGNASGKSKFIESLAFVKAMVMGAFQTMPVIPVQPFNLRRDMQSSPCHFKVQFLPDDFVHELSFSADKNGIVDEELAVYDSRNNKRRVLYRREGERMTPDAPIAESIGSEEFRAFAKNMKVDKRSLFITMLAMLLKDDKEVQKVINWFANTLQIIGTVTEYGPMEQLCTDEKLVGKVLEYLRRFDTGIKKFDFVGTIVNQEALRALMGDAWAKLPIGVLHRIKLPDGRFLLFSKNADGQPCNVKEMQAIHESQDNGPVGFDMSRESDGTRRMIDLVPAVESMENPATPRVFIIDELDRSMHHSVSEAMVEDFRSHCGKSNRSQFIFTTHDLLLMTQDLFRRDEMWVTEKRMDGNAVLYSLSEFEDLRKNSNIRKLYLDGRLGGIPGSLLSIRF